MLSPSHASCVARRQGEALTGVSIGQPLSRERPLIPGADAFHSAEGNMIDALSRVSLGPAWSKTLACRYALRAGTGRSPAWPRRDGRSASGRRAATSR